MVKDLPGTAGWRRGILAACAAMLLAPCAAQADIAVPEKQHVPPSSSMQMQPSMGMKMKVMHWDAATGEPAVRLPAAADAMSGGGGAWLRRSSPMLEVSVPGPYRWNWTLSADGNVLDSGTGQKAGPGFETACFSLPKAASCSGGCLLDAVFFPVRCSAGSDGPQCTDSADGVGITASMRLEVQDGVLLLDGSPLDEGIPMLAKVVAARDADGVPEMKTVPWRGPLPPGVPEAEAQK